MWFCGGGSRKWFEGQARGAEIKAEGLAMLVSGTRPREAEVEAVDNETMARHNSGSRYNLELEAQVGFEKVNQKAKYLLVFSLETVSSRRRT